MERFTHGRDGPPSGIPNGAFSGARDGANPEISQVVTTASDSTPQTHTYLAETTTHPRESVLETSAKKFDRTTLSRLLRHGPLTRLSAVHQRSFHLRDAQVTELIGPHDDSDYSLKGVTDARPRVQWLNEKDNPSKFRIEGLVPRGETTRARMKQDFLIAHGFPTEEFLEIYDLEDVSTVRYATRGESPPQMPVAEWKEKVLEELEFRRTHSDKEYDEAYLTDSVVSWLHMPTADIDAVTEYIKRTDYVAVLRKQPVEASFVDIQETGTLDEHFSAVYLAGSGVVIYGGGESFNFPNVKSFEDNIPKVVDKLIRRRSHANFSVEDATNAYQSMVPRLNAWEANPDQPSYSNTHSSYFTEQMLHHAFDYINNAEQFQDSPLLPDGGFVVGDTEHLRHFLQEFVPVHMADYLAGIHNLGISHGYAHGQNWKLGVFLMDLDSMKGVPFGDKEPSDDEKTDDVQRSIEAIDGLLCLTSMREFSARTSQSYIATKFLTSTTHSSEKNKIYAMRKEAVCQFLARYHQQQQGGVSTEGISDLLAHVVLNPQMSDGYGGYEDAYYADPPITKEAYESRIIEILTEEETK